MRGRERYVVGVPAPEPFSDGEDSYTIPLDLAGEEWLVFAPFPNGKGWARWFPPEESGPRTRVLMRFGLPGLAASLGDPLVVKELALAATRGIDAALVRRLGLGRLEAAVNRPDHHSVLAPLVKEWSSFEQPLPELGTWSSDPPRLDIPPPPAVKLDVPAGRTRRPDSFYAQVGAAYAWLTTQTRQPAQVLAEENDVPITTAHGWIKEARARGKLPPAGRRARDR